MLQKIDHRLRNNNNNNNKKESLMRGPHMDIANTVSSVGLSEEVPLEYSGGSRIGTEHRLWS